jgi:tetratricopeptide (TPR) repeat protein
VFIQNFARNPVLVNERLSAPCHRPQILASNLAKSQSFTSAERLPLIYFLVIFPVLVLGVFAWLVKKGGLITPADFSDQTLFLQMLRLNISGMQQKEAVSDEEDTFMPAKKESLQLGVITDLYKCADTEGFDGACNYIDQERDHHLKALKYRYLAIYFYTKKPDKLNCITAALRYKDLEGDITDVYRFLGYVYWRFVDFDTAIAYTEKALEAIDKLHMEDRDMHIVKIKNRVVP